MTRTFEPNEDPDIGSVWNWFEFQIALLGESKAHVLQWLRMGIHVGGGALRSHEARFVGMTRDEVEEYFDAQRGQLELLTMFELLATIEAILRIDFRARVAARKRDGLSKRYREINKKRGDKIRLDEDILAAMKDEGAGGRAVAAFRGALKLRDWLAHGRHWQPKLGRGYTPNDIFDISRTMIDSIPSS